MADTLTIRERDELDTVGWGTYWFGSLATRTADGNMALRSLVTRGLVEKVGYVDRVDGDGFSVVDKRGVTPTAMGWSLTDAGITACDGWRDKIQQHGRGPR